MLSTRVVMRALAVSILTLSVLSVYQMAQATQKLNERDTQVQQLIANWNLSHTTMTILPASDH